MASLSNIAEFDAAREELEALYGRKLDVFAGDYHARYLPDGVPVHIISRIFQGRHLLRPNRRLRRLIAGIIGRAQRVYPNVKVHAAAFLSNHFHAMLSGPAVESPALLAS